MKKLFLLITGIAVLCLTSCGAVEENNALSTEIPSATLADTNNNIVSAAVSTESDFTGYAYTIQDVHNLQDFLLSRPTEENLTGKAYDMNSNDHWDVLDLCMMKSEVLSDNKLKISVNGTELTAILADSTAAKELAEKLKAEPTTVTLNEYGGFEKVGKLPWSLTKTDESIVTEAGDIMLYQGNQMTIFYNSNSWSYTKLGHIDNITGEELAKLFGEGNITVTLSY